MMKIVSLTLMKQAFNRDWRKNYSWLPKGITNEIVNLKIKGSWSLIAGIWSDGQFLCMIVHTNVSSQIFQHYLSILKYALKARRDIESKNVLICLDNASTHTASNTIWRIKELELNVMFLPPYSPSLAPVELFFKKIKTQFRNYNWNKTINFNKPHGYLELWKIILNLEGYSVKSTCTEVIKYVKQLIFKLY